MGKNRFAFAWLLICFCQFYRVVAAYTYLNATCLGEDGNYTEGSVYQQNLDILLLSLSSEASTRAFYHQMVIDYVTTGDNPSKTYAVYQCRGDVSQEVCNECIQDAKQMIVQECPLVAEAAVWYEECMLRYANHSIFSVMELVPNLTYWGFRNVSNYDALAPVLASTLNSVINEAARNKSWGHFATKAASWTVFDTVYCLAQCTPDLTDFDCRNCLTTARAYMINTFPTNSKVAVFAASCQLRYDTAQQFYRNMSSEPPAPSPSNTIVPGETPKNPGRESGKLTSPIIAGIAVGASVGFIVLVAGVCYCLRLKKPKETSSTTTAISSQPPPPPPPPPPIKKLDEAPPPENKSGYPPNLGEVEFVQYDFATLKAATKEFSTDFKLGEGGFGAVYLGTLSNGHQVAVKRLSGNSGQGAKEFMTEAQLVAKLQHRNLVKLLGFCSEDNEKLLVYEFLPNRSLDRCLFDPMRLPVLDWGARYKIMIGVARGIQYLHEDSRLTIIHRDLKPSNILLDEDMNPKIADFGMARLFEKEQTLANTTRIVGTHGYMAPEYILAGEYSDKTDVYSFGIIILELVSGKRNRILYQSSQREDLSIQVWRLWNVGRSSEIIDPTLYTWVSKGEVLRCIQIGLLCVQHNPLHRPTMADVMLMLTGSITLPPPTAPAMSPQNFNLPGSFNDSGRQSERSGTKSSGWYNDTEQDLYPR